jgi:hypothetical protein
MKIVLYYCRGCEDFTAHSVVETCTLNNSFDCSRIECLKEDKESFIVKHEKGKSPTRNSNRVESEE